MTVGSRLQSLHICIFRFVLIFLLSVTNNENYFLTKEYIKELFFSRYQKRKLFSLKQKHFCFIYIKKKIKQFRFIAKKEIINLNYLRIFEEEVYYALYCPLNHIWP